MDISNIKSSPLSPKLEETLVTGLLRQFSSSRTAQLLEVVPLSRTQVESLLLKQVLPQALNKQLESYLKSLNIATQNPGNGNLDALSLVKLKPEFGGSKAFWSLTSIDLKAGSIVTIARAGGSLVILPGKVLTPPIVSRTDAQSSSTVPTANVSNNKVSNNNVSKTSASVMNVQAQTEFLNVGGNAGNSIHGRPTVLPNVTSNLLNSDPISLKALLSQIVMLSAPAQDSKLAFISGFRPIASGSSTEILKLSEVSKQPELKELGLLISRMQNWFASVTKFGATTPQDIKQALQTLGPITKQADVRPESLVSQNLAGTSSIAETEKSDSIKTIIEQLLPLLNRLELSVSNLSRSNSQLLDALFRVFISMYPAILKNTRQETAEKTSHTLKQLEQLAVGTLARLVSNQAKSVSQSVFSETALGVQIETQLLLRHNDQILPVTLFMREERRKNANPKHRKSMSNSVWDVFLEWEIDGFGAYHTSLKVKDNTVSATIWTEKSEVRQRIKEKISNLREVLVTNGVDVDTLQCSDLPLNNAHARPTHTVIDVRT